MDKAFDAVLQSEVDAAVVAKTHIVFWGRDSATNVCAVVKKSILLQLIVVSALLILGIGKEIMIKNVNNILDNRAQWNALYS